MKFIVFVVLLPFKIIQWILGFILGSIIKMIVLVVIFFVFALVGLNWFGIIDAPYFDPIWAGFGIERNGVENQESDDLPIEI